jgi:phage-related tail fiber protein
MAKGMQVKPNPAQNRLFNETYRGYFGRPVMSPEQSTQLMAKILIKEL